MVMTPRGQWSQKHIATLLGVQETAWSKLLNGLVFPSKLQTMQKIEVVFGWPVSEQVQLIPMYWEWPVHAATGKPAGEPTDMRYAIKLGKIVAEWAYANPRTVGTHEIKLHPDLKPISRQEGPRFVNKPEVTQAVEKFHDAAEKFVAAKAPLRR